MADPITWGLINLVKKGVKGVQTTLDGVSDKVSGLPESLDTDFTEVKNAIAGVKTDVGNVKNDTGTNIPSKIDSNSQEIKKEIEKIAYSLPKSVKDGTFYQFYRNRGSSQPYNTQYTAFSVTGKGYLYYAGLVESIYNQNLYVEIILDGKTIKINQNSDRFTGFVSRESIFANAYEGNQYPQVNLIGLPTYSDMVVSTFIQEPRGTNFLTDSMLEGNTAGRGLCLSEYALPFNNSLTVKLMNGGYGIGLYEIVE